MQEHLSETDLLIIDRFAVPTSRDSFPVILLGLPLKIVRRYLEDPYENVRPVHAAHPYIWLLYLSKDRVGFADLPQAARIACSANGYWTSGASPSSATPCIPWTTARTEPVRLAFDSGYPADRSGDQPQG